MNETRFIAVYSQIDNPEMGECFDNDPNIVCDKQGIPCVRKTKEEICKDIDEDIRVWINSRARKEDISIDKDDNKIIVSDTYAELKYVIKEITI